MTYSDDLNEDVARLGGRKAWAYAPRALIISTKRNDMDERKLERKEQAAERQADRDKRSDKEQMVHLMTRGHGGCKEYRHLKMRIEAR